MYYPILEYPSYYNNHFYPVSDNQLDRLTGNITLQNLGETQWFYGGYLDIDTQHATATLTKSPTASGIVLTQSGEFSGTKWRFHVQRPGIIKFQNIGESKYKYRYLDINPKDGSVVLTENPMSSGTNWSVKQVYMRDF
ncbi:hypothetical protein ACU82A_00540 [Bacillus cereus]